jgi:homopolymeric O-antigen transport system permease protein
MHLPSLVQLQAAVMDFRGGIAAWRLGGLMAWQDIKKRYRRSTLGPIWLTVSSAVQMLTISFLSTFLFNSSFQRSLPFVCAGMLFLGMISQMINDSTTLFLSTSSYLIQIKRPLALFLIQTIWHNMIVLAHNSVIYIVIAIILVVIPGWSMLAWPLGFVLNLICLSWMMLFLAVVSVRYRDIPVIVQNILGIVFWFTPLMYFPEQLGSNQYIVEYNPLTHMIALLRAPLIGSAPTIENWLVTLSVAVFGWIGTFLFFARFRARVVYWL